MNLNSVLNKQLLAINTLMPFTISLIIEYSYNPKHKRMTTNYRTTIWEKKKVRDPETGKNKVKNFSRDQNKFFSKIDVISYLKVILEGDTQDE